jgi:hypothetical protein
MTAIDITVIAHEIADAILAECAPGTIPSHTLMVREFTSAYELFDISPCERDHQQIADLVGELMNKRR